jgi:5-methylcytosine-specific restriction endonuclease McrA
MCPVSEKTLLKDIEKDATLKKIEVVHGYVHHKRLIPQTIYCKLKALRKCEKCGKNIHYPPQIHHLKPVKQKGSNTDINNLIALCRECHDIMDKEALHNEDKARTRI